MRGRRRTPLTTALVATTILAGSATADAATYQVTRTGDPAPGSCQPADCSLREAVLEANASVGTADTIVLPNRRRAYRLTIANTVLTGEDSGAEGDLDVTNDRIAIMHRGKGRATIQQTQLDRVLDAFAPLVLKRIGVTGGDSNETTVFTDGGAIRAEAPLKLARASIFENQGDDGGALNLGNNSVLTMVRSTIARNRSTDDGAAMTMTGTSSPVRSSIVASRVTGNVAGSASATTEHGGAIDLSTGGTRLLIKNSTFAGNRTPVEGGAIYSDNPDELTIVGSTFAGNVAGADGGALYLDDTDARIVNSTFYANRTATSGGAISALDAAEVDLNAVTVVRNVANTDDNPFSETGGGLAHGSAGTFAVANSLIALNELGPGFGNDCTGNEFDSGGGNVISTRGPSDVCLGFDGPGDTKRGNPKVGRLARNGGPTQTVAFKAGSPAIGNARAAGAPGRDQRGERRDRDPDSGAFER